MIKINHKERQARKELIFFFAAFACFAVIFEVSDNP
jgi:hypothetical protein